MLRGFRCVLADKMPLGMHALMPAMHDDVMICPPLVPPQAKQQLYIDRLYLINQRIRRSSLFQPKTLANGADARSPQVRPQNASVAVPIPSIKKWKSEIPGCRCPHLCCHPCPLDIFTQPLLPDILLPDPSPLPWISAPCL